MLIGLDTTLPGGVAPQLRFLNPRHVIDVSPAVDVGYEDQPKGSKLTLVDGRKLFSPMIPREVVQVFKDGGAR